MRGDLGTLRYVTDVAAQFFKGVATVCTKLFNAVEVGCWF